MTPSPVASTATRSSTLTAIVVCHTHWDREWYMSFERFRVRLVETIDLVLDVLEKDAEFRSFTLDGQTIVLEDYLAIRPEQRPRLERLVREGRLLVGPWYVLADAFLVSGESMVRNLLIGRQQAAAMGGSMSVGYLPDTFGHPAQLPQLLAGFGLDSAVVYRGVQSDRSEFLWRAPDGTELLTVYLPGGYVNAMTLSSAPRRFLEVRLPQALEELRALATTDVVLLMNGNDHLAPRENVANVVAEANRHLEGVELRLGTLPEYVAMVRAAGPELQVREGEFRSGRPARITPGVLSTRMYLKQANFQAATLLERVAEPLASIAFSLGARYPEAFLLYAWRQLLQNAPHDSICGCSIDPVHQDMLARYRAVQDVGRELADRAADAVARLVTVPAEARGSFLVFNMLPFPRRQMVGQRLHLLPAGPEAIAPGGQFRLLDADGRAVPHQVVSRRPMRIEYDPRTERLELDGKPYPSVPALSVAGLETLQAGGLFQRWTGEEVELLLAAELPAGGYTSFHVVPDAERERRGDGVMGRPSTGSGRATGDGAIVQGEWLKNGHLRVRVYPNGTFDLEHNASGRIWRGLNVLRSRGDAGDEYNYCPPNEDRVVSSAEASGELAVVESGPLRATLQASFGLPVPRALTSDRRARSDEVVELPIVARISLAADSAWVEVELELDNRAEDHLLQAMFPSGLQTEWADAQGQFEVRRRRVEVPAEERERPLEPEGEAAVGTWPQKAFVDVSDGREGLAVLNRGLAEYEAEQGEEGVTIALTLLRCVGWLSRDDLSTRSGHAGPALETPQAQCPGRHRFEYAVLPHAGDWEAAQVHRSAERYVTPTWSTSAVTGGAGLPTARGFVSLEPHELVFSALKKAEYEDALILRCYNTASHPCEAELRFGWRHTGVWRSDLAEQDQEQLARAGEERVSFPVRAHEIVTIKIRG